MANDSLFINTLGGSDSVNSTITLAAGSVHTLVVLDGANGLVLDNFLDAAGSGDTPSGAPATGFGGTAPKVPSALPWLSLIGAGLLLAAAGGISARRRPRPTA